MKKRVITALLVASILFHAVSTDFVSLAGDLEDITVEQSEETEAEENQVIEEEEIQAEEVVEDEIADDEDATSEKINTETDNVEKESVTEPEAVMPEAEITETKEESDQDEDVEFSQDKEVGGVSISLSANPGVLPEGAYFEAKEISSADKLSKMEESIEAELSSSKKVADIKAFDITIYDRDGNEIQPDTSKGNVKVSFKNSELGESISDSKTDVEVFHVADSMASAEAVSSSAGGDEVEFEAEHFSPYAIVSIEDYEADNTKEINEGDLIKSVEVSKIDASGKTPLTAGSDNVISKDDTIRVEYTFKPMGIVAKDGDEDSMLIDYVYAGKSYKIPGIPENFVTSGVNEITVTNGTTDLGKISFEGSSAKLTIADFTESVGRAEDAKAGFDLQLDSSSLGDSSKSSYELSFGNTKITVNIDEYMPKGPTVEKTASDPDANGNVTWTVTLKNDSKPIEYTNGYTFTDTLGDGQDYVADSFKINDKKSDDVSIDGSILKWSFKDNTANAVNKFTYQTKMDILANLSKNNNGGEASATVQNKVEVTAPEGEGYKKLEISDSASSTFNKNIVKWIDKDGGTVDENGVASWTVTVQNNGFDVYDVILTDKIVADSGVEITISDLKVVDGSGNEVTMPSGKYSYASNIQTFNFGEMSGTAKYVVTYKTKIENFGTYLKENHAVPKNEATITYKYKKGDGAEVVIPKGPTVGKDFKNELLDPKAAIGKVAAGYDASTHTIKWNVTVNKSKQTLTNVKVIDILPEDNEFVSISNIKKGDADFSLADASIDTSKPGKVTFTFGELKEVLTFTVTTKLTNNNVWASNATETYTNKVNLYYGSDNEVKATDSAPQVCNSNVIEKTAGTYDYSTRTIPYTIVVDTNKMLMDTVVVTDKLNEKLEYVDGSATGATPTYDKTTNTLTFSLGTINGKQTITFNAKVKDGDTFKDSGDIIIKNNATLTSDQCSVSTTTSDTTTKITNKVISKAGKRNNEVIDYTVSLNPAQQKLYTDASINEVVIQDTLGASLSLKEDSIHLYEATVATDGSLTKNVEITSPTIRTNIVNGKTVLEVVVPKDKDGKAFVLTYTAYMLNAEAGDFKNNVLLKGYGAEEKNVSEVSYKQTDFSSVNFNNYTYYVAELRDENDPTILLKEGHFQMVDSSSGKVIAEADISSKGEILLKGVDIKPNTEYKIIQTSAPEGYIIPEEYKTGKTITTPDKGLNAAKNQKASNTLYNAKPTKQISISKEDGLENAVTGAKLSITWKDSAGTKQTAESWTSGSAAKTFKASADILYTLTEESTPFGYKTANPIDFKVGTDGTLYKREGNAFNSVGSDKLVMIDVPMNSATISISKISATQGNNIEGAELIISKSAGGSNPLAQWTSSESAKQLSLPDGQYYLIETSAPVGYEKADAIPFEITADLELKVNGEIVSDKKIIMKDEYSSSTDVDGNDTSPKATVTFSPTTLGIDPDIFKSMKFAIFTKDSLSKKLTKVDWFNFDEDNQGYEYNLNYQDEYVIMPEGEIEGYDPVEPITFKVIGEDDGSGNIVTSMKMKTPGETFKEASLTDIGKKATPKPIPEPVVEPEIPSNETPSPNTADPSVPSNAGDNKADEPKNAEVADNVSKKNSSSDDDDSSDSSSSSHSYAAAKATNPVDALTFKDVEVNYGADTDEQSQPEDANGPRLAKTGGFIGTMAGYGVSIFLILFGLYLVFGKKKNYK